MGNFNVNPALRHAIIKQFDRWYAEQDSRNATNRTKLDQKTVLAPMDDDAMALRLGQERDQKLGVTRPKKGQGANGTSS